MEPSHQRRALLQRHLEPAEHAHERCVAGGMTRPVIFVLRPLQFSLIVTATIYALGLGNRKRIRNC